MTLKQLKLVFNYHLGRTRHLFIHIPKNAGITVKNVRSLRSRIVFADPYFHISRDYTRALAATMQARGEHLDDEMMRYFGLTVLPRRRNISTALPQDWRAFYNARTIQIVADWYRRDVEAFGFDFDTSARKHAYYAEPDAPNLPRSRAAA